MNDQPKNCFMQLAVLAAVLCVAPCGVAQTTESGTNDAHAAGRGRVTDEQQLFESTASRDFAELMEAISHQDGPNFDVVWCSAMQPNPNGRPWVPMRAVLIDPRVAKLFQLLGEMSRREAAETIAKHYERKLNDFKSDWQKAIDGEAPEHSLTESRRHGLAATLFLCQEFCDQDRFDQSLRNWMDWYHEHRTAHRSIDRNAGPDALLVINFYAIALVRQGEALEEIDLRVQQMCNAAGLGGDLPKLTMYKFYKWDATNRNDSESVMAEYPVFMNWGLTRFLYSYDDQTYEWSRQAMVNARGWVHPPSPLEVWAASMYQQLRDWLSSWIQLNSAR